MDQEIKKCIEILESKGTLAYPTDTIWGIGCDATNEGAVENIYRIKRRSESKKCIILIKDINMLNSYFENIPENLNQYLIEEQPTTIIIDHAKNLAKNLIAEDGSVAFRIPKHSFCQALLKAFNKPIVSTSANISGEASPRLFKEIKNDILEAVNYVVNLQREDNIYKSPSSIIRLHSDGSTVKIR